MQPLNCFARKFFDAPLRIIFLNAPPGQPRQQVHGRKKETHPPFPIDLKARHEKLRQRKFQERVAEVRALEAKLKAFSVAKGRALTSGMTEKDWREAHDMEFDMLHEQALRLAKQFNDELGMGLDFSKTNHVFLEVSGKGLMLNFAAFDESDPKHVRSIHVGLRPDGTYEKLIIERLEAKEADKEVAAGKNPNEQLTYFDSRTNESSEYNLPSRIDIYADAPQFREKTRFKLERKDRIWPSTE